MRKIAAVLNRSPSTIRRELKRDQNEKEYWPSVAQQKYQQRRKRCKRTKLLKKDVSLAAKVRFLLEQYQWFPEKISHRLKLEGQREISYSTIDMVKAMLEVLSSRSCPVFSVTTYASGRFILGNISPRSKKPVDPFGRTDCYKRARMTKISRYKQSLYQDWKDGEIIQQDYRDMKADYERQAIALPDVLSRLNAERAELANGVNSEHPALMAFTKYQNIDQLSRELIVELIDHIKIYENGNISVRFKFSDEFRCMLVYNVSATEKEVTQAKKTLYFIFIHYNGVESN